MTSDGILSERHNLPVPGDGQDEPSDDQTQARTISDPDAENWGDIIQTLLLDDKYIDGRLVGSGTLGSRPSAGTSAPKMWLVTNGGDSADQPYLTYNDDSAWYTVGELNEQASITSADSPYIVSDGESVWVDASGGATTVQLPTPDAGIAVRVVVVDATNDVTVTRDGTETIDGSASDLTLSAEQALALESDGANWRTVGQVDEASATPTTASGSVTLSGGTATVDTGVAVDDTTFWDVSLAPEDGADVAVSIQDDTGGTGNYLLNIEENTTSIGNPTVNWKLSEDIL